MVVKGNAGVQSMSWCLDNHVWAQTFRPALVRHPDTSCYATILVISNLMTWQQNRHLKIYKQSKFIEEDIMVLGLI